MRERKRAPGGCEVGWPYAAGEGVCAMGLDEEMGTKVRARASVSRSGTLSTKSKSDAARKRKPRTDERAPSSTGSPVWLMACNMRSSRVPEANSYAATGCATNSTEMPIDISIDVHASVW